MSHKLLWYKILKYGLSGNILTVLRNMYTQFKSCVGTPVGLTDYFSCGVGTRQGCVLSPFLFVLYINELMENMKNIGCQGIYIDENAPNIMMLYFADDIVDGADKCGSLSVNIMLDLFDKIVLPILLYGSQIWGADWSDVIENVHISFRKRILHVNSSTPNAAVLMELGSYPLAVHYHITCLKYWLKLLKMPNTRYPKACYLMLKNLNDRNRFTVRYMLNKFGFNYIWFSQNVDNEEIFLNVFKTRVKNYYVNESREKLRNSSKMAIYCTFKNIYINNECEAYLKLLTVVKHRIALSKLRLSSYCLAIEKGRRKNVPIAERICSFCEGRDITVLEDEFHFVCCCPAYSAIRKQYLFFEYANYNTFGNIMSSVDIKIVQSNSRIHTSIIKTAFYIG